ncbi:4-carboxy-4-hydroxy-2-oxoadipate aldolase/oxaloacetate decarboxylase [Micromonospora krabiensis]|uniref:Putative 4-hydroxy-4-methyl-2-oxoglutarate aldolase n=1 Tax=Micromonospora krabiensis TaxID=307121 RepID=A0A1C3MXY0_9ACTN|nr:4-carboxy-4-hydroxy-2-oxoadipate aldolase/oxaloacetate decarboxylase [Micromonospora krabiensis]SBV25179.1 4-hydroxy-4-methyl-2-oxoglutarate aldolase [Micromonospora krabiensis]
MTAHDAAAAEPAVIETLTAAGVATVYEAAGRRGLIDVDLVQVVPGSRVAGPARTVRCGQGDNRAVHEAMTLVRPGEVLVLTMPEPAPVALIGELLATQAKVAGAAGILVDAAVRDVDELRALGLPVWARWCRVRGATKRERGALDVPVPVGGETVDPGDVVVLDADGAVVVRRTRVDDVVAATRSRLARETGLRSRLAAGEFSYDLHGLRTQDESGGR